LLGEHRVFFIAVESGRQAFEQPFGLLLQLSLGDEAAVTEALQRLGARQRIHTVVIASGSDIAQPKIGELSLGQWKQVIAADLNGFLNLVLDMLPHMRARGGGSFGKRPVIPACFFILLLHNS